MSREEKSAGGRNAQQLMRAGVIVLVLSGKYAGRKAVIVKSYDERSTDKPFGHALCVGIDRYPRRIIRRMGKKRRESRCKIKPFVRVLNYNHLMPTRYSVNMDFDREVVNKNSLMDKALRPKLRMSVKNTLQQKFLQNSNPWFFQRLRF